MNVFHCLVKMSTIISSLQMAAVFFLQNMPVQLPIHLSFNYTKFAICWKQSHTKTFPSPNFTIGRVLGVMSCAIFPPRTFCIISKQFNFGHIWPDCILSLLYCLVQMLSDKLQTSCNMLYLINCILREFKYRSWQLSVLLTLSFRKEYTCWF